MSIRYVLICLAACGHPASPIDHPKVDVEYTLELVASPSPTVRVTVAARAASAGATELQLADNDWYEHSEDGLRGVTATAGGRPASVSHHDRTWVISAAPDEPITMTYTLVPVSPDRHHAEYGPVETDHFIHLVGLTSLVYPAYLSSDEPKQIAIRWVGFADKGWQAVSSYGTEPTVIVREVLHRFVEAVFLASDSLHVLHRDSAGSILAVAVVDAHWAFPPDELADLVAKLMAVEWSFIGDKRPAFFLADLVPFGPKGWSDGNAMNHSFAVLASPESAILLHEVHGLGWTLAHELFHTWNGHTIMADDDSGGDTYWFSEGFTNFYARRLLFRAGLISVDAYRASLDQAMQDYEMSPFRDVGPETAKQVFSSNFDAQLMTYHRGELLATLLDREIRRTSGGARSLDDVMKALVVEARAGGRISTAKLLARFERETSPAFAQTLRTALQRGGPISIDPALFEPCFTGEMRAIPPFDLGFDLAESQKQGHIVGLRPGSRIAAQGVHEGDPLGSVSVWMGDPSRTATFGIGQGTASREVSFLPQGDPFPVLGFRIHDEKACATAGL